MPLKMRMMPIGIITIIIIIIIFMSTWLQALDAALRATKAKSLFGALRLPSDDFKLHLKGTFLLFKSQIQKSRDTKIIGRMSHLLSSGSTPQ